jgi:hypothetical protein
LRDLDDDGIVEAVRARVMNLERGQLRGEPIFLFGIVLIGLGVIADVYSF